MAKKSIRQQERERERIHTKGTTRMIELQEVGLLFGFGIWMIRELASCLVLEARNLWLTFWDFTLLRSRHPPVLAGTERKMSYEHVIAS